MLITDRYFQLEEYFKNNKKEQKYFAPFFVEVASMSVIIVFKLLNR